MISSINSMSSAMSMVRQSLTPDSDGLVSKTEFETLATGIEEVTGTSIDIDMEQLLAFLKEQNGSDWEFSSIDVTG